MSKGFAPHRVVTRDAAGKIVGDLHFDSFAAAEPVWSATCETLRPGQTVVLQHGARVIKTRHLPSNG